MLQRNFLAPKRAFLRALSSPQRPQRFKLFEAPAKKLEPQRPLRRTEDAKKNNSSRFPDCRSQRRGISKDWRSLSGKSAHSTNRRIRRRIEMAHLGMLRDYEFEGTTDDIRGADLFGPDNERLGEIDDVIFDHATGDIRYLVVDTGGWLSSDKFVVPANRVEPYHQGQGEEENDFYTDLTRERIQMFPAYDETMLDKRDAWAEYERKYEQSWADSPVMHQEATGHIITPPASEVPSDPNAKPALHESRDFTPRRVADKFAPARAGTQTSRLADFQENIRTARNTWAEQCEECKKAA
jgi:sporulation protein YlmC with PRC-barrel domain